MNDEVFQEVDNSQGIEEILCDPPTQPNTSNCNDTTHQRPHR